jgi:type IV secretory pathway VirD2 relaxase
MMTICLFFGRSLVSTLRHGSATFPQRRPGQPARRSARECTSRRASRARVAMRAAGAASRRVVVKVHISPMRSGGAKAAALHLRYIERDGVEKDGAPGRLYGADDAVLARDFETPRVGEAHQFRLIVSPEDAGELDLAAYVRRLMHQVERDLGQRLEWAAVSHHDTDHPHAHVVVHGVDRDGAEVRPDARTWPTDCGPVRKSSRPTSSDRGLSRRSPQQRLREVNQERFTSPRASSSWRRRSLDRQLESRAVGSAWS